jgi:hypothetical protein
MKTYISLAFGKQVYIMIEVLFWKKLVVSRGKNGDAPLFPPNGMHPTADESEVEGMQKKLKIL